MDRVDALTDVAGLRVGHARLAGAGALTGTTVVLAPEGGAVAAVD
ncbi:P1 family peptidase, partial [Streptomyces sp. 12297]